MKVVRFPSWAERRRRNRGIACIAILSVGLIAWLTIGFTTKQPLWLYFVGLGAMALAGRLSSSVFSCGLGASGEKRAETAISSLDDRHCLIRNWTPDDSGGDIDLLLLGPFGTLVVECKTYSVPVRCDGDRWTCRLHTGEWRKIGSHSQQLARNVSRIKRLTGGPVYGVIVFNDRADLAVKSPTAEIIRRRELLDHVKALPEAKHTDISRIEQAIFEASQTQPYPKSPDRSRRSAFATRSAERFIRDVGSRAVLLVVAAILLANIKTVSDVIGGFLASNIRLAPVKEVKPVVEKKKTATKKSEPSKTRDNSSAKNESKLSRQ
ncbi:MAG: NERD domain-containing protein [Fimbriimonadaceae bacterium]|nr:NERD domain-containing protein [Fimbriimonadaceae bacterium]